MESSVYVQALDPFAVQFWDGFGIRWYGLAYLTGFVAGYLAIYHMVKRGFSNVPLKTAGDFVFAAALGTIIGGRLGYCILYSPDLLTEFSGGLPYWGVLKLYKGGMASHGGILGIVITCLVYGKRHNISGLHLTDLSTLGGSIGIFFGRIANFINGELVGRPADPNLPWAVKFPQDILSWPAYEPHRLQSLSDVVAQLGISRERWTEMIANMNGSAEAWNKINGVLDQIVEKTYTGSSDFLNTLAAHLTARHPSQLYAAMLEGAFVFGCLMWIWRKPRKPGVITAWFFSLYSLVRIIDEEYRLPDLHIGYQLLGLTRGQWLSVLYLACGLIFLAWCSRRNVEPIQVTPQIKAK